MLYFKFAVQYRRIKFMVQSEIAVYCWSVRTPDLRAKINFEIRVNPRDHNCDMIHDVDVRRAPFNR